MDHLVPDDPLDTESGSHLGRTPRRLGLGILQRVIGPPQAIPASERASAQCRGNLMRPKSNPSR